MRRGGTEITGAGESIGRRSEDVPLVGEGAAERRRAARLAAAGEPLIVFGTDLERLLIIIGRMLGGLLVAVAIIPWLNRFLPWRIARWRRPQRRIARDPWGRGAAAPMARSRMSTLE